MKHMKKIIKEEKCLGCNSIVTKLTSKYCNKECYFKDRARRFTGTNHPKWQEKIPSICLQCKNTFQKGKKAIFCSRECKGLYAIEKGVYRGKNNGMWKGGRTGGNGHYILILKPEHPNAANGGYVAEHRLIMENKIGRYLDKKEIVHHINHKKDDNALENLQLMTKTEHDSLHRKERAGVPFKSKEINCFMCGVVLIRKVRVANSRCHPCHLQLRREGKALLKANKINKINQIINK